MRSKALAASLIWAPLFILLITVSASADSARFWDFEGLKSDAPLQGLSFVRAGKGPLGNWVIQEALDAPSGTHVLAQLNDDRTDYRFPMAISDGPLLRNVQLSVSCKFISGKIDQAGGLVFRYRDENNYTVVRANALEQDIQLFKVVDGSRASFARWKGPVTAGVWHHLRVTVRRHRFTIYWDGQQVLESHDKAAPRAGLSGLWTKADSVTFFDDFEIESL